MVLYLHKISVGKPSLFPGIMCMEKAGRLSPDVILTFTPHIKRLFLGKSKNKIEMIPREFTFI